MDNSFRLEDVFSIEGRGMILCGPVTSGQIKVGSTVMIEGRNFSVAGIEAKREEKQMVMSGENVGILLKGEKADKDFFRQQIGKTLLFND